MQRKTGAMLLHRYRLNSVILGWTVLCPVVAMAGPAITLTPPNGARFVAGQRFDIRLEVTSAPPGIGSPGLSSVEFAIDGEPVEVPDPNGAYSYAFNLRAQFETKPGFHTLWARAKDSTGVTVRETRFEIIDIAPDNGGIRNIILCIGDGMSNSHRTAARLVRYGVTGGDPDGFLAMDQMPGMGLLSTHSLNSIVTDSAPGMSCYVSGNHNNNNQEGVFPDNTSDAFDNPRIEYLSQILHRTQGKVLGIVSTADIEDATPAANVVHTANRGAGTGICDQYLDEANRSGLRVLLGGGRRWFLPAGQFGSSRSASTDYVLPQELADAWGVPRGAIDPNRNLISDFEKAGFAYASTRTELKALGNVDRVLGLFAYGNMNVAYDKIAKQRNPGERGVVDDHYAPDQPMLDEMTETALRVLNKNENGFVLMIEAAHIDKQSHAMDADRVIWDTIEFDRAIAKCIAFADENPDTLVLVTADHECAGFTIIGSSTRPTAELRNLPAETGLLNPSDRPQRQAAVGVYEAARFPRYEIAADGYPTTADPDYKLLIGYGANANRYEDWLAKPLPLIESLTPSDIANELRSKGYPGSPIERKPESQYGFFIRGHVAGSTAVHTAGDVPISSYSTGENNRETYRLFTGVQRNTDVFFGLMRAAYGDRR